MLKSLYSDDLIEFKDNNKWIKGNLKDIVLGEKKFILSLEKEKEKTFEHTSDTLFLNNLNYESIMKNENETYSMNQSVEFFDESSNSWIEGTIKSIKNDFYLISYITKKSINNTTILHKNNIRPLISNDDILKLNLHNAQCYSLKNFEPFSNPVKYAKKFIKNLINLLGDKIFFVFLNNNFDLFIFNKGHENESNHSINEEIINGLINVAVQHFEEIDKVDKQLFK